MEYNSILLWDKNISHLRSRSHIKRESVYLDSSLNQHLYFLKAKFHNIICQPSVGCTLAMHSKIFWDWRGSQEDFISMHSQQQKSSWLYAKVKLCSLMFIHYFLIKCWKEMISNNSFILSFYILFADYLWNE